MAKSKSERKSAGKSKQAEALELLSEKDAACGEEPFVHLYVNGYVCDTDKKGHATPESRSPTELVVDATEGFIPLWDRGVTLRWRFQKRAMTAFRDPDAAKDALRKLLGEALLLWGDAPPVKFSEVRDRYDFEIVVRREENCSVNGCVLASAFFPDAGQHNLVIYPTMFEQSRKEQVETLAHEIGHVFGLRHFFANISEQSWRSEIFGKHSPFSIMNYGDKSMMTDADRSDLKTLYAKAWNGELTEINGTPIQLMRPYSASRDWFAQWDPFALQHGIAAARQMP
jgi:hypothetical protein